ncbi:MAG: integrase core domain-containing protein, partial [Planctomycetaceae bacterium]
NRILREKLGPKRLLLTDDQRRRLALKGKSLGRKALAEIATLFTPDTILRWHRQLIARKWDYSDKRISTGRPRVRQEIIDLALRLARENPTWGCDRIQGSLANVGYCISDTTVENILKAHGLEPAPDRKRQTTWKTFLKSHWDVLAAADFTTVEVWTRGGLVTFYLFFVIHLKTRRVELAGITTSPDSAWMQQTARNLTNAGDGFLSSSRYLILDRDGKYSQEFRDIIESAGTKIIKLPPRSPNLNAFMERFMRTVKSELLSRMIFFGEASLRRALSQFLAHYHEERNHQGLNNRLIQPGTEVGQSAGPIRCRQRLGGLLRYYYRDAA